MQATFGTLAVAPGSPGPAAFYASEMGRRVRVATVAGLGDDTIQMIAGRVPWVIAIDEAGIVVSEDHGTTLVEVVVTLFATTGRGANAAMSSVTRFHHKAVRTSYHARGRGR